MTCALYDATYSFFFCFSYTGKVFCGRAFHSLGGVGVGGVVVVVWCIRFIARCLSLIEEISVDITVRKDMYGGVAPHYNTF